MSINLLQNMLPLHTVGSIGHGPCFVAILLLESLKHSAAATHARTRHEFAIVFEMLFFFYRR